MSKWRYSKEEKCVNCGHAFEDHGASLTSYSTSNGCLHVASKDESDKGFVFCPCNEFAPRAKAIRYPIEVTMDLPPIGAFPMEVEIDTGETWDEIIAKKKIPVAAWTQQAQHFMKHTLKIDSMSVNGHQLETILVAFAEKMNVELMTRMEQVVQERLSEELLKQTKKVSSTFKKNSRKFRPDEG
jgi:hypothetical protein